MKIRSFLKPYRLAIVLAVLFVLVELTVELFQPIIISKMIDDGILQKDLTLVLQWGGLLLTFSFFAFLSGILNSFYASHVCQSFGFDLRERLYEKVQSFSFTNFIRFPTSSLITRLTNDVVQLQNTVFIFLRIALRAPLLVLGSVMAALFVHIKLASIIFIVVLVILFFLSWIMKKVSVLYKQVQTNLDSVNRVMQENLIGMRLIRVFLRRNYEIKRFTKASHQLMDRTQTALRVTETTMPGIIFVMNLSIMGILWFGSVELSVGNATEGEIVAIINYATRMMHALSVISMVIMNVSRAKASAQRTKEVLNTTVDVLDREDHHSTLPIEDGRIQFKEVTFTYPDKKSPVLTDVSFEAKPREIIAVMGATGSGKTSLFQLIPRLYDANQGIIQIDGIDIHKYKLEHLRKQIGYVPQQALLFTGTVKENIAWGKTDASMEEIIEAAKCAQIHDTIMQLPNQYETVIGQRGVNLSGGQKQRLSIARALVRKPKILLLDDSTSALDLRTEAKLLQSLKNYSCTILMITQKVSSTINANWILLLEDGRIVAQGRHEQLLETSKLYNQIYQSQNREELEWHVETNR